MKQTLAWAVAVCGMAPALAFGLTVLPDTDWQRAPQLGQWTQGRQWEELLDETSPVPAGEAYLRVGDPDGAPIRASSDTPDTESLFAGNWQQETEDIPIDADTEDEAQPASDSGQHMWFRGDVSDHLMPATSFGEENPYLVSFANWGDWAFPGASEESYLADLAADDWIGITYLKDVRGEDDFNILNGFDIPEPHETAMLAVAAILIALDLLRRRNGLRSRRSA